MDQSSFPRLFTSAVSVCLLSYNLCQSCFGVSQTINVTLRVEMNLKSYKFDAAHQQRAHTLVDVKMLSR